MKFFTVRWPLVLGVEKAAMMSDRDNYLKDEVVTIGWSPQFMRKPYDEAPDGIVRFL